MIRCLLIVTRVLCVVFVFFFQAEDGIRDLVRSRGLGDVYKRQAREAAAVDTVYSRNSGLQGFVEISAGLGLAGPQAVSYTHLTLPTSDLV